MNKQFLKENKWTLLPAMLNTMAVLYGTLNLAENIKEMTGGDNECN